MASFYDIFFYKDPCQAFMQNLQQQLGAESQLQSLPPAVQKAIFLHLTQQPQKQQESQSQGNEPQRAESQDDNSARGASRIKKNISWTKNIKYVLMF